MHKYWSTSCTKHMHIWPLSGVVYVYMYMCMALCHVLGCFWCWCCPIPLGLTCAWIYVCLTGFSHHDISVQEMRSSNSNLFWQSECHQMRLMVKPANTIETAMLGKLGCWNYQNQTGKHVEPTCNWIQNWLIYIRGARCTWTKNSGKPWCLNHSAKSQATGQKVRPFDSGPPLGAVLPQIPATLGQTSSLLWFPLRFQPHVCPRSLSWASIACDP